MMDLNALANRYGTPLYLYDFNHITTQFRALHNAFGKRKSLIAYAVKANSNLSVIKHLAELGAGADCVSIGEVRRAIWAGVPVEKIIFSGVGKRDDEIQEALQADILMINIESEAEVAQIEEIATSLGKIANISVRVNPNIDAKTHPYISTGLHSNKFGVDIPTAKRIYTEAHRSHYLNPIGIHFHIGSQLTDLAPIREATEIVSDLFNDLDRLGVKLDFFDVGGGLSIQYDNETPIDPIDYAAMIRKIFGDREITFVTEPGRYLVGNCGLFLTRVLYEKKNGDKRFVIVDGAMNDLLRPALYNAYHKIEIPDSSEKRSCCDVVGPICESGDFFGKNVRLPKTHPGDLVVIHSTGAYGAIMGSNYNTRPAVAEIALHNGEDRLIRRRESFEDIIKNEIDFLNGKEIAAPSIQQLQQKSCPQTA